MQQLEGQGLADDRSTETRTAALGWKTAAAAMAAEIATGWGPADSGSISRSLLGN